MIYQQIPRNAISEIQIDETPNLPNLATQYEDDPKAFLTLATLDEVIPIFAAQIDTNYDGRKYPICAPHDGTKGLKFRRFADDFITGIAAIDLKDTNEIYDLGENLLGIDEGGSNPPPGGMLPIPAPTSATGQRRRARRNKLSYTYLYQHITDLSIRKMLVDEAYNDGPAAWQILVRECDEPITDLELEDLRRNVRSLTIINTVGYQEFSVSLYRRALNDENAKIPNVRDRIGEPELCLITLRAIARASAQLSTECDNELKALPAERRFKYPPAHPSLANERCLSEIVKHFEPLWKSAIQRGTIPLRAATSKQSASNSRVDGFSASTEHNTGTS